MTVRGAAADTFEIGPALAVHIPPPISCAAVVDDIVLRFASETVFFEDEECEEEAEEDTHDRAAVATRTKRYDIIDL